jgi:hypothetical protein
MAITRAQQVRQMLEDGGMLVSPSTTGKRPGYRSARAQEVQGRTSKTSTFDAQREDDTPEDRRDTPARLGEFPPGFNPVTNRFEKPDGTPEPSRTKEEVQQSLDAAIAQGKFKKKNPIEKFLDGYTKGTRKTLYSVFPNRPTNELDYLRSLPAAQRALLSPALRAKLEALELDEDQDLLDTANTKFTFDEFEDLRTFQPTDDTLNFAEYAAKYKGAPGLLYSGNVGDLVTIKNPDGTYRYERRTDDGPNLIPTKNIPDPTDPNDPNQTTDVFAGIAPRFAGSIFDFDKLRRQLEEQSAADGGRIGAMEGGIMDFETAREAMFLGGIVKGLKKITKKATRAVKKVAKSPIGKAALLGLGAYYMPGFGIKATGGFSNFTQPGGFLSKILTKGGDKALSLDNLSGLKISGLLTAAPFLFGKTEEEDDPDPNRGPKLTMEELLAIRGAPFNTLASRFTGSTFAAEGGRMGYQEGSKEPVAKKVMPLLDMGGKEMDLRDNGGFVPIGRMEKADDVPARLSKNEFVFTADAVRNAGDGDVDKGSEVMYNMMKNLESGGEVSEESQGLQGAREMFQKAQRLEEVI